MTRLEKVRNVLFYTLILNMAVAAAKIIYGYKTNSIGMLSDGFHSFSDGISNVIGLAGVWIASKPPDESHPYGHRKFETLSTIAIALLIFMAGIEVLRKAYLSLRTPHYIEVTSLSFIIMATTLLINIGVMIYETRKGRELKSDFLLADALHTKTDIFISISVVISLIATRMGYPVIDTVAAVIITLFIAKLGLAILKPATDVLTDAVCIDPDGIRKITNMIKGVKDCHEIRTRGKDGAVNLDLHILVDSEATTQEAHELSHSVEKAIKKNYPSIIDVVVHIEPYSGIAKESGSCTCSHEKQKDEKLSC
ncbi:MAG: cation diffusion facilitator family transporter [Thermodesulfovibrionia bacterium]